MLGKSGFVDLARHALVIGILVFAGLVVGAVVGGLLGEAGLGGVGELLQETFKWTGIVTAVLYAFREG